MNEFQQRIGVGAPCYAIGRTGPTRSRKVVIDEGPRRGSVGGFQVDHKDGRQDATVLPAALNITTRVQES